MRNSNKLYLDKYYTPYKTMKYCVKKTLEILKDFKIEEFVESSAGNGIFSNYLKNKGYKVIALDIEPEGEDIIKADYLDYPFEYKQNRCIIGNPPYGNRNTLSVKFYKKSIQIADYISFILPISQLNNNMQMYEFDLIHSEDLGKVLFSDKKKVHCCLNIYKRPNGELNKKPVYKLEDVEIIESRRGQKIYDGECDLRICAYGTLGKVLNTPNTYVKEFCFIINNKKLKDKIINTISNVEWAKIYPQTCSPNLLQWQVIKYLKEQIPKIK